MHIIETENLTKRYGDTVAVDRVSIHVKPGEIYGFLGLNGAGKTTTIRLLLGLIKPDGGSCRLFGEKPRQANKIWNDIGYLIETPHAYPDLSVTENLAVISKLRGLTDSKLIDEIIDKLKLTPYKNKKEKHLSLGNKQRLGLAKALIHRPKLLLLDEPINGLDPAGIVEIRELLKELSQEHNITIFLSSHILAEIAKLTNRIGIIHNGALIREVNSEELDRQLVKKLNVNTGNNSEVVELLKQNGFEASLNSHAVEVRGELALSKPETVAELLVKNQVALKELSVYEEDLEHYFLRIINE